MRQIKTNFFRPAALVVLCFLGTTVGCKKDNDTLAPTQDFSSFTNFDKLRIGSGFRTTVRQGTTRQVLIAAPSSDQSTLRVTQSNGTLVVEISNKSSQIAGTVDITMPSLAGIDFSGGVDATITGFSPASLPITLSGGGTVNLMGSTQALTLTLSGGSKFNGYDFPATDAVVTISGGSEARVAASKTLNVTATGGSKLFYKGTATLTQNLSGSSTVTKE